MDVFEKDKESKKEEEESKIILKIPIIFEEEKYSLKIFPSKDNISLIFKLEKERVETFYFYAKFKNKDFMNLNEEIKSDTHINNIFILLKQIIQIYTCSIEKKSMNINILFTKKNNENSKIVFSLKKKIVSQNRLNMQLMKQIQENKSKIKLLKKQLEKLDKTILNKNDSIEKINNNIDKIITDVNNINININNLERISSDNYKTNNKNNNNKNSPIREEENEDLIKKNYKINEKDNLLLKKNLSLINEYQKNTKTGDEKGYTSNNRKRKNKLKNANNKIEEKHPLSKNNILFCFDNIEVFKNKKIYETLIIVNVITVLIIMYLLCSIHTLKIHLKLGRKKNQDVMKKLAILNFLNNSSVEEMGSIRENIVDFQLESNEEDNMNINQRESYSMPKKRKFQELKEITLLKEEKEKRYYKKHIRRRICHKVKEITFQLKYNYKESYKYINIFNNYKNINEVLVLIKTKDGQKFGVFTNNIIIYDENTDSCTSYCGYVYKDDNIYEMNLKDFFDNYGTYLQNIFNFLKSESLRIKNKYIDSSSKLLGDIELFEIYQVKYTR